MPFVAAASLTQAAEYAPRNTWHAYSDDSLPKTLPGVLEDLRDLFFGALDISDPTQAELYQYIVPLQYDIEIAGAVSSAKDAWSSSKTISKMCRAAALASIPAAVAAALLAAYNTAFSP